MKIKLTLFLVSALLSLSSLQAQQIPEDAWLWNTLEIDKKLTRSLSLDFTEELRLFDNMSRINLFFTNIGINYKLNKNFKFSLVYRFINKNQNDVYYSKRHRLYLDISYRHSFKDFNFIYRIRFQGQVRDYYSSDNGRNIERYMRHKFDFQYNYKKFTPYLAAEFRFQFTNPNFYYGNDLWDRYRLYAGSDYKINRQNSFGLYYMIQRDFNNKNIERDYTIGIEYSFSF